jgi:hypothetical protein
MDKVQSSDRVHASPDECLLLIRLKRENARAAMQKIIVEFAGPPHHAPAVLSILDYLTNMVYCIELMLKLLSDNWRSHDIPAMYQSVVNQPHPDPELLRDIKTALVDQKYLFEPNGGLLSKVPNLEALYQELIVRVRQRHPVYSVQVDIPVPLTLLAYMRDFLPLYYVMKGPTSVGPVSGINLPAMHAALAPQYEKNIREMRAFVDAFTKNGGKLTFHQGEIQNT